MSGPNSNEPKRESAGGGVVLVVVLVLAVIVGASWVTAYAVAGDDVPRGTTVAGFDIGGRDPVDAALVLEQDLEEATSRRITVQVDGAAPGTRMPRIKPARAGLSVDYRASVAQAAGSRTWNLQQLLDHFTRSERLDPVVVVDSALLDTAVARIAAAVEIAPLDGRVVFRSGGVRVKAPRNGAVVDPASVRDALLQAFLTENPAQVSLTPRRPEIDEDDVRRALNSFANPALSASVTLVLGNLRVRLNPQDYMNALSMKPREGKLVPVVASSLITSLVERGAGQGTAPVDATFQIVDGRPEIVPAQPGTGYEADQVSAALVRALGRPETGKKGREVTVRPTMRPATVRDRALRRLKIKEQIGSAVVPLVPGSVGPDLARLAALVDGQVLRPHDNFSLAEAIAADPADPDGAPATQLATALFVAGFRAGLMDTEHHPQDVYAESLPKGLDATVSDGRDLRFRNDSGHGVLIDVRVKEPTARAAGSVRVRLFGTPRWDVQVAVSEPAEVVAPKVEVSDARRCLVFQGVPGFSVKVARTFRKPGKDAVDHRTRRKVTYEPAASVECRRMGRSR